MRTRFAGFVQVGFAAVALGLSLWASAPVPWFYTCAALAVGAVTGRRAGRRTGRAIERQAVTSGRIVLYSEDTPLYGLALPLTSLALSPGVFLSVIYSVWTMPALQVVLPLALCILSSAWLAHDTTLGRHLTRLAATSGPIPVHWFHARSVVGPEAMIGRMARVSDPAHVRFAGERWQARTVDATPLRPGGQVIIHQVDGLVLVVGPVGTRDADGPGGE